ncbi:MAG: GAF domain-containing protein, partial [Anaerolineales bacterium]
TMDIDGEPFVACFIAEITDHKQAEVALRINLERLEFIREIDRAILAEQSPRAIAEVALAHIRDLILCQRASVVLFDFETDQMEVLAADGFAERSIEPKTRLPLAASDLSENFLQGDIEVIDDISTLSHASHLVQALGKEGLRSCIEIPLAYKDVLVGSLNLGSVSPIGFPEEQIEIAREVADLLAITIQQARLFEQVRVGRDRMRRLTHQLVEAQEAERKHIANELHDEIGQLLTGLKLTLDTCKRSLPAEAAATLGEADKIVAELVDHLRKLSLDLRPAALDDLGLLHALLRYFERYTARTAVEVDFEHSGMNVRFPPDIEIACYRIIQEALTNVARHAGVGRVTVSIHSCRGRLRLGIEDEGFGFDTDTELAQGTSSGLVGMRERAIALGGQLTIDSAPGIHTRLFAELPLGEPLKQKVLERVM